MFEDFELERNVGCLAPMPVVDNIAYEFYAMAPKGIMLSVLPIGAKKFTKEEIEALMAPLDEQLHHFAIRKVDLMQHSGVPLLLTIGLKRHNDRLKYMEDKVGCPATSSLTGVTAAAKKLGLKNVAFGNNFNDELNEELKRFFHHDGVGVAGHLPYKGAKRTHEDIKKLSQTVHMGQAYDLGKRTFEAFPKCDGIYMGGGAARLTPVVAQLEKEFGRPVIGHQDAMVWDICTRVGKWKPYPGYGKLLATS
jgi:maleate cis-trans isomerase